MTDLNALLDRVKAAKSLGSDDMSPAGSRASPPVSSFDDTGLPAWQEIRSIVDGEAPNMSQHIRDELAGMLVWARYGKQLVSESAGKHADTCGCGYCT